MTKAEFRDLVNNALSKCEIAKTAADNIFSAKKDDYYEAVVVRQNAENAAHTQYDIDYAAACAARDASTKE